MKDYLILLTSNFPYGTGESFLESELIHLSHGFSEIVIVPTDKGKTSSARTIPSNCRIDTSIRERKNRKNKIQRLFSKTLSSLAFPFFYKELIGRISIILNSSSIERLMSYSLDSLMTKKALNKIVTAYNTTENAGLIYSYWFNGSTLGATLLQSKLPVITRVHRGDLYEELYPKNYIPFREITLLRLDSVFSISKDGINYLKEKYPAFSDKIFLSRLGIPVRKEHQVQSKKPEKEYIIVSCSFIHEVKRVKKIGYLLKKFALLHPDLNLVWNHFGAGELFDELSEYVKGFPKNIKAKLHGFVENKELIDWYSKNRADLFINLSKSEGIPVSIMEANSFGIPAIATNVGGTSELVNNDNGWLINDDNLDSAVLTALEEATSNEPLRKEKSIAAKNTCSTVFNSDKNYSEFVEIIKAIIRDHTNSAKK